MDRSDTFNQKFSEAAAELSTIPEAIVSIKLREGCCHSSEYHELITQLEREYGFHVVAIRANLQGKGYSISNGKQKAIIVEHETGLEILYIAGSVASLIGIVPIILNIWNSVKGYIRRGPSRDFQAIETRKIVDGSLIEDRMNALEGPSHLPLSVLNVFFSNGLDLIDREFNSLRAKVKELEERVRKIEKPKTNKKIPTSRSSGK